MEKLIVIIDEMSEYARQLAVYLNGRRGFPYRAVVFSFAEEAKSCAENGAVYAVLASEQLEKEVLSVGFSEDVRLFWLSETKNLQTESVLYRYRSAKEIEKRLMQPDQNRKEIPVIGVYSPAGGVGMERLSREIAKGFSKEGKVLYFPFLPFGIYGKESRDGISELLFYVKQRESELPERLCSLMQKGEYVDSFAPVRWSTELRDITKEDMECLLRCIEMKTEYCAAVLAVGQFDAAGSAVLGCCDIVLTPVWDTEEGHKIQEEFLRQLKEAGETGLFSRVTEFLVESGEESVGFSHAVAGAVKKGGEVLAGRKGGNSIPDAGTA
ncbi:MAG: hypothetical protein J1E35_06355 [Lachnospiraceae bacterium]|nr:hypothetical protein [Lachnospiraceae bacterium]